MGKDGIEGGTTDDAGRAAAPAATEAPPAAAAPPAGEVVRLSQFDARNPARVLGDLRAYWASLCRGRAIPARADVEPRGLRNVLAHAFILERIAPGAGRFRLAGRHLIDLMGMEVRGMPLCAFFNPPSRGRLSDVLETVFAGPQIAEFDLLSPAAYGRSPLPARMLVLPLRSDLGDVTRALGALVATAEPGRPPRRFDLLGERLSPVIEGARTLDPTPSAPGFGEAPAPWRPSPRAPAPPPALLSAPPSVPPSAAPAAPRSAPADAPRTPAEARRAAFRVIDGDG